MKKSACLKDSQIRELEKCIAAGDIAGMAKAIEQIHQKWDSFNDNMKKDIQKLESVFLSMVNTKAGGDK